MSGQRLPSCQPALEAVWIWGRKAASTLGFERGAGTDSTCLHLLAEEEIGKRLLSSKLFPLSLLAVSVGEGLDVWLHVPSSAPGPPTPARASRGWCAPAARLHATSGNSAAGLRSWRASAAATAPLSAPGIQPHASPARYRAGREAVLGLRCSRAAPVTVSLALGFLPPGPPPPITPPVSIPPPHTPPISIPNCKHVSLVGSSPRRRERRAHALVIGLECGRESISYSASHVGVIIFLSYYRWYK